MMDCKVPVRSSLWRGTGTVTEPCGDCFCMTTWLPRLRTSRKPCFSRIEQTALPDSTRSLPNRDLDVRNVDFVSEPLLDFLGRCALEEQFDCFLEVVASLLDGVALASDVQFRA